MTVVSVPAKIVQGARSKKTDQSFLRRRKTRILHEQAGAHAKEASHRSEPVKEVNESCLNPRQPTHGAKWQEFQIAVEDSNVEVLNSLYEKIGFVKRNSGGLFEARVKNRKEMKRVKGYDTMSRDLREFIPIEEGRSACMFVGQQFTTISTLGMPVQR